MTKYTFACWQYLQTSCHGVRNKSTMVVLLQLLHNTTQVPKAKDQTIVSLNERFWVLKRMLRLPHFPPLWESPKLVDGQCGSKLVALTHSYIAPLAY